MKALNIQISPKQSFIEAVDKIKSRKSGKDAATSHPEKLKVIPVHKK